MKVAVTGAGGFIGRYVVAELGRRGVEIVAVDRDVKKLPGPGAGVNIVELDIASPGPDCFARLGRPDVVIHLAWDGLPNYRSLHHFESELPKQYHFLRALIEEGLSALSVTGTCFEYGMVSGALSEDLTPRPANPYSYAKDALRRQLGFLKLVKPFNLTWARLFYMYGGGQAENSLFTQLKKAVESGDKVFNMSGGEQLRDYLPVAEVARRIVLVSLSGLDNGTVNICSGSPVSVRGLVERWLKEQGWQIQLNLGHYPYPDYEPMAFWGNAAKYDKLGL